MPPAPVPASRLCRRGRRVAVSAEPGAAAAPPGAYPCPASPVRGAPFAGYITRLPAEWAKLNTSREWGARESPQMSLPWPPKTQEGNALDRAQADTGGAAPLRIPIFSIFGICAKLLGWQWWGAGAARLLHLFELASW